jgi:NMD protein affecting ribosome stability and mRNA decay
MKSPGSNDGRPQGSMPRRDRLIQEQVHDTYKSKRKLPEPTLCPQCGAVYHGGRWQWSARPAAAHEHTCPACHRIQDKYPAGSVALTGSFLGAHRDEVLNVVRNAEARAKADHPLKRIIAIEDQTDGILVTTTDPHLARGIGEALHRACSGELRLHYTEESDILRVEWKR